MKALAISDIELSFLYNPQIAQRFAETQIVFSCGDLPYYYLEFIVSMLNVPLYYVRGNHASKIETTTAGDRSAPWGAYDLHRRVVRDDSGLFLAGIEGSLRYNLGPHQYTQAEMWAMVLTLTPQLLLNRLAHGRYLDVFISHAPPFQIHDMDDLPHRGIHAFRWLIRVFQPTLHLHGHIHIYRNTTIAETRFNKTTVLNAFGYREFELKFMFGPKKRPFYVPLGPGGVPIQ
jgi:Icc-related predicted phosphoesterase